MWDFAHDVPVKNTIEKEHLIQLCWYRDLHRKIGENIRIMTSFLLFCSFVISWPGRSEKHAPAVSKQEHAGGPRNASHSRQPLSTTNLLIEVAKLFLWIAGLEIALHTFYFPGIFFFSQVTHRSGFFKEVFDPWEWCETLQLVFVCTYDQYATKILSVACNVEQVSNGRQLTWNSTRNECLVCEEKHSNRSVNKRMCLSM